MVAALLHLQDGAGAPLQALDRLRRRRARRHDVADQRAAAPAAPDASVRQVSGRSFSALPTTWSTSGIAA